MAKDEYHVIGVMSGTSLDGIDLVHAKFQLSHKWTFEIIHSNTVPYGGFWKEKLRNLVSCSREALSQIDIEYTKHLAETIRDFTSKTRIGRIDAICSHGHTALHRPQEKLTYQIGNRPIISELTGATVVCDFRVQDVALGGQGAPLVPIGDALLFPEYDFCLNLGGFANISTDSHNKRIAYDICPVNIVLNHYAKTLGHDYDNKGSIASSGNLNTGLLKKLNAMDFYRQKPPKSLGLEWVKACIFPLIDTFQIETKDVLHTFCEHVAIQISNQINKKRNASVLVSGGGAYNSYLINRLKSLSKHTIVIPQPSIIEFKEALIFAFLGVLKLRNEVNSLKSVTGAAKNHSSGIIYTPDGTLKK